MIIISNADLLRNLTATAESSVHGGLGSNITLRWEQQMTTGFEENYLIYCQTSDSHTKHTTQIQCSMENITCTAVITELLPNTDYECYLRELWMLKEYWRAVKLQCIHTTTAEKPSGII